ncbi:hypothetical protein, partial [Bradyrhizobium sp. SZCCHNR3003]|uniref:hypothetical protein n=1 Tax=Bradyrhizobium sp. SZCCHNR3003 TaxID=3057387 RepID=UPI002915F6D2
SFAAEKGPHPEEPAEGGRLEGWSRKNCAPSLFHHMRFPCRERGEVHRASRKMSAHTRCDKQ